MGCKRYSLLLISFLVAFLTSCNLEEEQKASFRPFTLQLDEKISGAVDRLIPFEDGLGVSIDSLWRLNLADFRGGANVSLLEFTEEKTIRIPHRILLPDHSIWYQTEVQLGRGVLRINADDGAQLWLNGERVAPELAAYYPVAKAGNYTLTIRVLNNAMAGGLRSVEFIDQDKWESHKLLMQRRALLREVLTKEALLTNLSESETRQIVKAKERLTLAELESTIQKLKRKPVLLAEPIFQKGSTGQLYARWVSSSNSKAKLIYGKQPDALSNQVEVEGEEGVFLVAISDSLKYYRVIQDGLISPVYIFPEKKNTNSQEFMVWADSQSGWKVFDRIMRMSNQYLPHFSVGAGDLVGQGDDEQEYLRLLRSMHLGGHVHYPVPGNHDYDGYYEELKPNNFSKYLGVPNQQNYYAWKEGDLAFIALDLNETFPVGLPNSSEQYRWFMEQIQSEAWTSAKWRFLVSHHPPYSQGWPGYHGEISLRNLLLPLYEKAKIDMVIAGHTHDYERKIKTYGKQKTAFVIVGGAGGGLEPKENASHPKMDTVLSIHHFGLIKVTNDTLNFKAIDLDNIIIDNFFLTHD